MNFSSFNCALISSIIENIFIYPFDVYKTLKQQQKVSLYEFIKSPIECKYRGFYYRTIGNIPMRIVFWTSQDYYQKKYRFVRNDFFRYFYISSLTSFNQTLIDTPIENLKINKINNSFKSLPILSIYRGFSYNYIRNNIFVACVYVFNKKGGEYNINKFISGSSGGLLGCFLSQPIDYLKTLKQSNMDISFRDLIYNRNHIRNCMSGFIPRATCGFFGMGIGSFVYDSLKKSRFFNCW